MCGIAIFFDPERSLEGVEASVVAALHHRGPDGSGHVRVGPARLIHTRLAIIDVDGGDQPLVSEDGSCTLIVNGEIYNHRELRAELEQRGHRFATNSDSEVVLHAYEEHGLACVDHLNGIFGWALWDEARQRMVVARDQFGVKPVYWWTDGRRVAAASEIGALHAAGLGDRAVDPIALQHYLAWHFVPAPRTMFAGISKLPAASMLIVEEGRPRVRSFREAPGPTIQDASVEELAAGLQTGIVDAVQRQMMSDVPYGAFLSGGVDSAAVAASMARAGAGSPRTFTVGFPGHGDELDERAAAQHSADAIGTEHHAVAMTRGDFPAALQRCVARLEEPCGTASAPALLELSRFTAQHVKVVLSGQGADEPLGGYKRHQPAAALRLIDALPGGLAGPVRFAADRLPRNERAKRAARLLDGAPGIDRMLKIFEIAAADRRQDLLSADDGVAEAEAERRSIADAILADVAGQDPLHQVLYLDTHLFLPDGLLVYGDKMTMAHGLEQRVPFLDLELMRYVQRIPARLRVRRFTRKWLYRQSVRGLVPDAALDRPKHPFATPYDQWLRTSLGEEVQHSYRPASPLADMVAPAAVTRLVDEHRAGRDDHKRILYCLLELAAWHRTFVEQAAPGPVATA